MKFEEMSLVQKLTFILLLDFSKLKPLLDEFKGQDLEPNQLAYKVLFNYLKVSNVVRYFSHHAFISDTGKVTYRAHEDHADIDETGNELVFYRYDNDTKFHFLADTNLLGYRDVVGDWSTMIMIAPHGQMNVYTKNYNSI